MLGDACDNRPSHWMFTVQKLLSNLIDDISLWLVFRCILCFMCESVVCAGLGTRVRGFSCLDKTTIRARHDQHNTKNNINTDIADSIAISPLSSSGLTMVSVNFWSFPGTRFGRRARALSFEGMDISLPLTYRIADVQIRGNALRHIPVGCKHYWKISTATEIHLPLKR